ncbi:MAG TPA: histidine kinase [Myxococcales bacterium]|nr:histidine kinase [Myxococcales bacterium]
MALPRLWRQLSISFVAWTAIAVLGYARVPLWALASGREAPPLRGALQWLVGCWIWALITPAFLWLAERYPLDRRTWRRNAALHVFVAFAIVPPDGLLDWWICRWLDVPGIAPNVTAQMTTVLFIDVFSYAATIALGHALTYYRVSAAERLRTSQLEARLLSARMEALEARMHPHFLFNALNTVSSLVRTGESQGAIRAVARLGDLLRTLLLDDGQEIPVAQEFDFVGRYLELEQLRFGDRLSTRIEAEPGAMEALVPRLVLQPLVENALRHGIEPSPYPGRVEVRAARRGDMLELEVRDSGARGGTSSPSMQIGLKNTRARLQQLYGDRQELALSTDPQGTVAKVLIPFRAAQPRTLQE